MNDMVLTIGDKNLSSWSLRPWLLMKQAGIPFSERTIRLDQPSTRTEIAATSPSGLVPCLDHKGLIVWDSLAIGEYLAETFPDKQLWPAERRARARARSVSAEMHSGFAELRKVWPMNFARTGMRHLCPSGVRRDIDRIAAIWTDCRSEFGTSGPFLFGTFSIADAMYAPVVSRFMTYGPVSLPSTAEDYVTTIFGLPAMKEWGEGATAEVAAGR
jgi:glutathione S-transferase